MLASRHFKLKRGSKDDWFDPIVDSDTQLFLDPFLVFKDTDASWSGAHGDIITHFDYAFRLIAEGNLNPQSIAYRKALHLLVFTEPKEMCLGYTARGTAGAGSGRGYAQTIAAAITMAIRRGLKHPRHFEELGVLNEGIGADRISDITSTILKRRLVAYTQEIAERHRIPMTPYSLYAAGFDGQRLRWESSEVRLPTNPRTHGPLLLVPHRFLRDLPTLNADDWWDDYQNEQLRQDVNYEIMRNVRKADIIAAARRDPEAVRRWTIKKEAEAGRPYDLQRDPEGVWQWDSAAAAFAAKNPLKLSPPKNREQFFAVIELVIAKFRSFVEDQKGWWLLWDAGHDKQELAPQLVFKGIARAYCEANNVSLDPEVNLGRGPVDFKFSNGFSQRAHLEVKKLHNGKFWNGLREQLPTYMRADEVQDGWFLAVQYRSGKAARERLKALPNIVRETAKALKLNLRWVVVDARPTESASKL